ncbi:MAG: dTDP-glucose 4,6-dehydratase [Candidatus Omnitrophica bacterium]|nr:dTDP-glucose 4,6-dehydratase [Candidatus Omnitrophota bacterium]
MRILITGGCGFIGSNFIRYLLKKYRNYRVINLDKLTYAGNLDNLKDIKNGRNYTFVKGDICNLRIVNQLVKDCDIVINFAAESHVDRSIMDPLEFIQTNVYGTCVLLQAVKKNRIPLFCQISTDEVYGSIKSGSFDENSPLKPNSPYAASKASADLLCRSYLVTYGIQLMIIRSCNNFGPFQYPEKVMPLFITNILQGKKVPLYGQGRNIRDWLYVEDNCRAIDLILHKGKAGQIYNVGSDTEITNLKLTKLIAKKMGKDEKVIKYVKDRPGHDFRYSLKSSKIKALGFKPKYTFDKALDLTIQWYKDNRNWWKKLK